MVLSGIYRTPAESDENKQGLKTGPLTARRKFFWECGGSVRKSGAVTILRCSYWKGREQNLTGLGSNKEELLLFQLFIFLQKGGDDQSWCDLNRIILLSSEKTTLSCLLLDNRLRDVLALWVLLDFFFPP